jgi:hypothetical protein
MGYYGGAGARLVQTLGPFEGTVQPDPPIGEERLRECQWKPCTSITIPDDWLSGIYLGKLSLHEDRLPKLHRLHRARCAPRWTSSCSAATTRGRPTTAGPTILRSTTMARIRLGAEAGIRVSYDRPYGKYCQILDSPLTVKARASSCSGNFRSRTGSSAKATTSPTAPTPTSMPPAGPSPRCKAFLSVGHDEYWSLNQYNHVMEAIQQRHECRVLSPATRVTSSRRNFPSSDGRPAPRPHARGHVWRHPSPTRQKCMGPFPMDGPDEVAPDRRPLAHVPYNGAGDWIAT